MPCWGGAEIYLNRLNDFLNVEGHNSFIYTGMPSVKDYDNGSVKQKRLVLPAIQDGIVELGVKHGSGIIFQDWTKLTEHTDNWLDLLEKQLKRVGDRLLSVLEESNKSGQPTDFVARRIAWERINS